MPNVPLVRIFRLQNSVKTVSNSVKMRNQTYVCSRITANNTNNDWITYIDENIIACIIGIATRALESEGVALKKILKTCEVGTTKCKLPKNKFC